MTHPYYVEWDSVLRAYWVVFRLGGRRSEVFPYKDFPVEREKAYKKATYLRDKLNREHNRAAGVIRTMR